MTYSRWGNNSVGQSSVLIKRRSRVQVPVALPILRKEKMPRRTVNSHMLVLTDEGLVLVDKDGNRKPLTAEEMKKFRQPVKERSVQKK